jgi:glycyl-tRNA synthetase
LRVREFTLAEIEHFVDPDDKAHPKFKDVADLVLLLFPRDQQMQVKEPILTRLGDAVGQVILLLLHVTSMND